MARWKSVQRQPRGGDCPPELVAADEPLWRDVKASRAWFRAHGLEPGPLFEVGPANRRKEAIEKWAVANGCARADMPRLIDWRKLNGLGLERYASAAVHEQLAPYMRKEDEDD